LFCPVLTIRKNREKIIQETKSQASQVKFLPLEVTDVSSVSKAAKTVEAADGKLDILVNNAGALIGGGFFLFYLFIC
jgi:NAD(P)-dependent dehydrogenase (short-subunit alcohol dehydrogenase family)